MSKPIRVLFVTDNGDDVRLLSKELGRLGFKPSFKRVSTFRGMKSALAREKWDAVISEYSLKNFTGMDALALLKESVSEIPFIMISKQIDEETLTEVIKAGAHDFISRKFLERLGISLSRILVQMELEKERSRAIEELKISEERLELAISGANLGLWDWDIKTGEDIHNERWAEILGYSLDEIEQNINLWKDSIHPDDRQKVMEILERHFMEGTPYESEHRLRHKNGDWVWIFTTGKVVEWDEDGKPVRMAGTMRDISSRKKTELALKDALNRQESIFRASPTGIGLVSDRIIKWTNKQISAMTGYSAEELLGQDARMIYPTDEEYKYVGDEKYRQIREKGSGAVETRWQCKDGRIIDIFLSSTPLDPDDFSAGVTFTALDITGRKKAEKRQEMMLSALEWLNQQNRKEETIREILIKIKNFINLSAVGIRLNEANDYPYFETMGFSDVFLDTETSICSLDEEGNVVLDSEGRPLLDCWCGRILKGDTDPSLPWFTESGSFWTNSISDLIEILNDDQKPAVLRNRCGDLGYESLALIPLKSGNEILGLLQLNDFRKDAFTPDLIRFFERIAMSIGVALDRKKAAEELRESEEKFRILATSAPVGIFLNDKCGNCTYANDRACEIVGMSSGDILKLGWMKNIHQEDKDEVFKSWKTYTEFAGIWKRQFRFVHQDGEIRWVDAIIDDLSDETGAVMGYVGTITDITERRLSEKKLVKTKDNLTRAQQIARLGSFEINLQTGEKEWSDEMYRIMGINPQETLLNTEEYLSRIIHPADRERVRSSFERMVKEIENVDIEFRIVHPDDSVRLVRGRTFFESDNSGRPLNLYGTLEDITERKKMEEQLSIFRFFAESSGHGQGFADLEGSVLYMNPSLLRMLDIKTLEDVAGRNVVEFYPEDLVKPLQDEILPGVLKDGFWSGELPLQSIDGVIKPAIQNIFLIRDYKGNPLYFGNNIIDITERKLAEEEIKKKNRELETALAVKTEFLSMVSHELRTPLVPIIGYSELLLDGTLGDLPDDLLSPVQTISSRAEDLAKLIEDLLILSRMEKGKLKLKLEPLNVKQHIQETLTDFQTMDLGKNISVELEGDEISVLADHTRMHQVFRNLIDNSIKYSGDDVAIHVKTEVSGKFGIIHVKDTGMGIDKEHLPKIFDRFYQVESIDTREHDGTGLGLAITKELLEMMAGTISVESVPGIGSTFTIRLPLS